MDRLRCKPRPATYIVLLPRLYDCLNDLKRSDPPAAPGVLPMKEARRTDEPVLPQKAEPVDFGGKNDVFARGISYKPERNIILNSKTEDDR